MSERQGDLQRGGVGEPRGLPVSSSRQDVAPSSKLLGHGEPGHLMGCRGLDGAPHVGLQPMASQKDQS